ncbi:MAG: group II intron reverse transcriptase/maturase [Actinobacteria bacterium]|nr:group II intron reverse transcriptase/maturase [Actinomycetota bacterium]
MSLSPPLTVGKLQTALHTKAKASPDYRFYALYDKLYRRDVLLHAYQRCRANKGSPGVDGQTFDDIQEYGLERWLDDLTENLRNKTYRPDPVRRVWIAKADGKTKRPLGIPTTRDRVVQMAAVLVMEPIFEADLPEEQHGYRPEKSALGAVQAVQQWLDAGFTEVVDADLSGYFDNIPHAELMKSVARRISDRHLLHLIKMWLEAPVEETDERGRKCRTTPNKDEGRGTPQGGVASPLLANLYMRRFVVGWKRGGHEQRLDAHIVNYADDFVICCKAGMAEEAMKTMRQMMEKLRLTVNEKKTRQCRLPEETFDFLGYTFGRCFSIRTGRGYLSPKPKKKKIQHICQVVSELTDRRTGWQDVWEVVKALNARLAGWANYFSLGPVQKAYRIIGNHAKRRLRRWLCKKHRVRGRGGYTRYPDKYLHDKLGLIRLEGRKHRQLWA